MGRNTKNPANSPAPDTAKPRQRVKKERRNRSKKRRPDDIPGLVVALNEGLLDQRTQAARDALVVRDALARDPRQVATALVRDALALDAVIMSRISAELLRPDSKLIDDEGNPHELIRKHWPDVRAGILRGSKTLVELDHQAPEYPAPSDGAAPLDISSIVLSLANAQEG